MLILLNCFFFSSIAKKTSTLISIMPFLQQSNIKYKLFYLTLSLSSLYLVLEPNHISTITGCFTILSRLKIFNIENMNYNKCLLFIHLLMHISKCRGVFIHLLVHIPKYQCVFDQSASNFFFDLIYC